ncbi:MAG: FAD-dependent oxidoreductase, partial [Wolinella sp.]
MVYDVIIIGAGIAGLYASLQLPKDKKVLILCKDQPWECNTFYAQGGIALAKDQEDVPLHVSDTLGAGVGLCDVKAVETLSQKSLGVLADLLRRGVPFDRDLEGNLLYTQEGAHSISRIVHAGGDGTGRVVHSHLMGSIHHTLWKNATVTNLLLDDTRCHGVSVTTKRGNYNLYANEVIIATGGVGALFEYHTNAHTISSDLHGMIIEHGLKLRDMEMLQFHPTVFVKSSHARKILLSEALRGEGAKVVD